MSDCSNSRMEPYTPQDVCKLRVYFYGQNDPWTYPLALNGRVIKDVMIGETHYVAERMCSNEEEPLSFVCSVCGCDVSGGDELGHNSSFGAFKYCPNCMAKVVGE